MYRSRAVQMPINVPDCSGLVEKLQKLVIILARRVNTCELASLVASPVNNSKDIKFLHQSTGRPPAPGRTNTHVKKQAKHTDDSGSLRIKATFSCEPSMARRSGRAVVNYVRDAHTLITGIKCRDSIFSFFIPNVVGFPVCKNESTPPEKKYLQKSRGFSEKVI